MCRRSDPPVPRLFYKYTSPDTVRAILRNNTFRYSSPLLFNDPFDFQPSSLFKFSRSNFRSKIIDWFEQIASAKEEPRIDAESEVGEFVYVLRQDYPTHGFPRKKIEQQFRPLLLEFEKTIYSYHSIFCERWRKESLPNLRVFCVSEDRDNLLMWAHYAKDYEGAVFEICSLPDEDNTLSGAEHVIYHDSPPPFFTENEWFNHFFGIKQIDPNEVNKRYACSKNSHWKYEHEWRVWYQHKYAQDRLYDDLPIRTNEVSAIYFGCRAKDYFINETLGLTKKSFPSCKFYRAYRAEGAYELRYAPI